MDEDYNTDQKIYSLLHKYDLAMEYKPFPFFQEKKKMAMVWELKNFE